MTGYPWPHYKMSGKCEYCDTEWESVVLSSEAAEKEQKRLREVMGEHVRAFHGHKLYQSQKP